MVKGIRELADEQRSIAEEGIAEMLLQVCNIFLFKLSFIPTPPPCGTYGLATATVILLAFLRRKTILVVFVRSTQASKLVVLPQTTF